MNKEHEIEKKTDSLTLEEQFKETLTEKEIEKTEENIYSLLKRMISAASILFFTYVPITHLFKMERSNEYYTQVMVVSALAIPINFYLSAYLFMCFSFLRKDLIKISRLKREIKQGKTKIKIPPKNNSIEIDLDIEKNTLAKKIDLKKNRDKKILAPNYSLKKKLETKTANVNSFYKHRKNKISPIKEF